MADQKLELSIRGLWLNDSSFSSDKPEGPLFQADDVVLDRKNIVVSRRGFARYGTTLGVTNPIGLYVYNESLLVHTDNNILWYDSDDNGTWVAYSGAFSVPGSEQGSRIRSIEANKNIYFTTSNGIYKTDDLTVTPFQAGAPKGLSGSGATTGASGFMSDDTNVAYRVVWSYRDRNKNLILGPPSERIIVSNSSGGTRNVILTFQIPEEIDTTWFYQVYRSDESATINDPPNDELKQTLKDNPTSGEIVAQQVVVTDTTPNDLLQASLYTNPSQQGILQSNYRPPFAQDIAQYKNYTFYANTRTPHRMNLTLVAAGAPNGIQIGDTITFTDSDDLDTVVLTGAAAEDPTVGEFQVFSTGNPAIDIDNTARSIVAVLNRTTGNDWLNGYYISDYLELPGQMLFEKISLSPDFFYVNSSRTTCFTTPVAATGDAAQSENDNLPNRLYFSKVSQPEAVPIVNYFDIGSANKSISRILALRDSLIILKDGEGIWNIQGTSEQTFVPSQLDNSINIIAPNTANIVDNKVYFLSNQGVVAASDSAVVIVSRPIYNVLQEVAGPNFPTMANVSFGIAYNSDNKYLLPLQSNPSDQSSPQQYVYNYITDDWVRWTRNMTCGIVKDDVLYHGGPFVSDFGGYIFKERKNQNVSDLADEEFEVEITVVDGTTLFLASVDNVQVDDTIQQTSSNATSIVVGIGADFIVVEDDLDWDVGDAIVYRPINNVVKTIQIDCGNAGVMKHCSDFSLIFTETAFDKVAVTFETDSSSNTYTQNLFPTHSDPWGGFPWGEVPWGGGVLKQKRLRTQLNRHVARANWVFVTVVNKQAFTSFGLSGYSMIFTTTSPRQKAVTGR